MHPKAVIRLLRRSPRATPTLVRTGRPPRVRHRGRCSGRDLCQWTYRRTSLGTPFCLSYSIASYGVTNSAWPPLSTNWSAKRAGPHSRGCSPACAHYPPRGASTTSPAPGSNTRSPSAPSPTGTRPHPAIARSTSWPTAPPAPRVLPLHAVRGRYRDQLGRAASGLGQGPTSRHRRRARNPPPLADAAAGHRSAPGAEGVRVLADYVTGIDPVGGAIGAGRVLELGTLLGCAGSRRTPSCLRGEASSVLIRPVHVPSRRRRCA
jgi:hypothetical protein